MRGRRIRRTVLSVVMVFSTVAVLTACGSQAVTLEESLEGALDEGRAKVECEHEARDHWRCGIEDDPGSGGSRSLLVRVDRRGCWHAFPPTHRYEVSRCDP